MYIKTKQNYSNCNITRNIISATQNKHLREKQNNCNIKLPNIFSLIKRKANKLKIFKLKIRKTAAFFLKLLNIKSIKIFFYKICCQISKNYFYSNRENEVKLIEKIFKYSCKFYKILTNKKLKKKNTKKFIIEKYF